MVLKFRKLDNPKPILFIRINTSNKDGAKRYFIRDEHFQSITELIKHYREHGIPQVSNLKLGVWINEKIHCDNQKWFMPYKTRENAIEILRKTHYMGSFLIRLSDEIMARINRKLTVEDADFKKEIHSYTLCFLYDRVYFVSIFTEVENNYIKYSTANHVFESLSEIVEYFKKNPLIENQTLTVPATSR